MKNLPKEGGDGMTKSPGERPLTADPIDCTSPTPSYPPTAGTCGLTGYTPFHGSIQERPTSKQQIVNSIKMSSKHELKIFYNFVYSC